jgi:hypothetical protein
MVMQNLHIVKGKPGWSGQFLIATFNQCGRFSAMRFEWRGEEGSKEWGCRAHAIELASGEPIIGAWVTWKIVEAEGWNKRDGSKWLTMPEQMFLYRSGAFLVRAYAPEIAMGLPTAEELVDTIDVGGGNANGEARSPIDAVKSALRSTTIAPPPSTADDSTEAATAAAPPPHRGRGRPRKTSLAETATQAHVGASALFTYAEIADAINKATTMTALDEALDLASHFPDPAQRIELIDLAKAQRLALDV